MKDKKTTLGLLSIIFLAILIRFYQLDKMPGEIYGDIVLVFQYLERIAAWHWPFDFVLSSGPVYHYVIYPFLSVFGWSYLTLKIVSAFIDVTTVFFTYYFAKPLIGKRGALLTALVSAVSSWLIIFARLGNSQAIIPLITVLSYAFLVRKKVFFAVLISSLGWYTYPQTFILPPLISFSALLILFGAKKQGLKSLAVLFLSFLLFIPFVWLVFSQKENFTTGYIGGHILTNKGIVETSSQLVVNFLKALGMFHLKGDVVFRSNVSNAPHLDQISGVFFLLGIIYFLFRRPKEAFLFSLVPILVLILPSASVISQPSEVPSASRSIAVTPFVFLLVALGVEMVYQLLKKMTERYFSSVLVSVIFFFLVYFNLFNYFFRYIPNLPNYNVPFARLIGEKINELKPETQVYITDCCWGEWGQPEPQGIYYALSKEWQKKYQYRPDLKCEEIDQEKPYFIVINPKDKIKIDYYESCLGKKVKLYTQKGEKVASFIW